MQQSEHSDDPTVRRATRDDFIDLVRAAAILRVVFVHAINPLGWLWWPAPLWVMPGMPLVFFCSGALMWTSLERRPDAQWSVVVGRLRRLLVPTLTVLVAMGALSAVLAMVSGNPRYSITWHGWYRWLLWDVPAPSVAVRTHNGQMWFAGTFTVVLAISPFLAALHRRRVALLTTLSCGLLLAATVPHPPSAINHLAMYTPFFCAGFYYGDGTLPRLRAERGFRPFVTAAVVAALLGAVVGAVDGRSPNAAITATLTVATAWLFLILAAQPTLRAFAGRHQRGVRWVSARTLSIYLAGWPAASAARRTAHALFGYERIGELDWTATYLALTTTFLVLGTAAIYPLERLARRPIREWVLVGRTGIEPVTERL
ncbi:MAG: acyltransferase family protein [Actinomycetes bacterium]